MQPAIARISRFSKLLSIAQQLAHQTAVQRGQLLGISGRATCTIRSWTRTGILGFVGAMAYLPPRRMGGGLIGHTSLFSLVHSLSLLVDIIQMLY